MSLRRVGEPDAVPRVHLQIRVLRGGLEHLHLAFYRDTGAAENERWHFWRLEGPGFVWNYRVLPHVHCYVNIGQPA